MTFHLGYLDIIRPWEHCKNNDHEIDWEHVDVLAHNEDKTKKLLLESYFIKKNKSSVNKNEGMVHSSIFNWALESCKTPRRKAVLNLPNKRL